jgi:precorrin-3B methylase
MLSMKTLKIITAVTLTTVVMEIYNPTSALAKNQVSKTNSVLVTPKKQTRKTLNVFKILRYPKQSRISR